MPRLIEILWILMARIARASAWWNGFSESIYEIDKWNIGRTITVKSSFARVYAQTKYNDHIYTSFTERRNEFYGVYHSETFLLVRGINENAKRLPFRVEFDYLNLFLPSISKSDLEGNMTYSRYCERVSLFLSDVC